MGFFMSYEIGSKFGKLLVVELYEKQAQGERKKYMARCLCDCGGEVHCEKYNLRTGNTTQCKSCAVEARANSKKTHCHSESYKDKDPLGYSCYTRWSAMKRRCNNPSDSRYADYGGRGIKVCARWQESYEAFLADMGLPPSISHQIDREDNHGNYEPGNCKWVTRTQNARNKRNNNVITAFGETNTLSEWAAKTGVMRETIAMRLSRGYSPEEALEIGSGRASKKSYVVDGEAFASIKSAAERYGLSISGAHGRFKSDKYPGWIYS